MRFRFSFKRVCLLVFTLISSACAAGMADLDGAPPPDGEQAARGVQLADFETLRYNAAGELDPALNSTLSLRVQEGAEATTLTISVADSGPVNSVTLDVNYDARRLRPLRAEFHGLLGTQDEVLRAAFINQRPGIAGLGEVLLHDARAPRLHGDFATLYFCSRARAGATAQPGDAHSSPEGVGCVLGQGFSLGIPNLVSAIDAAAGFVTVTWYAGWHTADGDQNHEVNAADLTPLGAKFQRAVADDFGSLSADYDGNGLITISDITPIGLHFKEITDEYIVQAADDWLGASRTTLNFIPWNAAVEPVAPVIDGELRTVFKSWTARFDATSQCTYAQLMALDSNGNQRVKVYITPQETSVGATSAGVEASIYIDTVKPNSPPSILGAVFDPDTQELTVSVADADNDPLTVAVTEPAGLQVSTLSQPAVGGVAIFQWSAIDPLLGGSGTSTVHADDGQGGTDSTTLQITIGPPGPSAEDTLYVLPAVNAALIGESVFVTVVTANAANPFQALNNCSITIEEDASYKPDSFNVGAVGGAKWAPDGVWAAMGAIDFQKYADATIVLHAVAGGRIGYCFNVKPFAGSDITSCTGGLFSFELTFSAAGTYHLGIENAAPLGRTFYSDGLASEYEWGVLMADAAGVLNPAVSGYSNVIDVTANPGNHAPSIDNLSFDDLAGELSVTVSDVDGDDVTVGVAPPAGLGVDFDTQTVADGSGTALFHFAALDLLAGGSGSALVTARDPQLTEDSDSIAVGAAALQLNADTLYILPLTHSASVGQPVRAVVLTGPTASPMKFFNACGVTIESSITFDEDSFNAGALGGAPGDVDGAWLAVAPTGLWPPMGQDGGPIGGGRLRYDWNVVPFGGVEVPGLSGYLLNFILTFDSPGIYHFGLQRESDLIKRTYYSNAAAEEFYWGTLMADETGTLNPAVSGVDNTVTVN